MKQLTLFLLFFSTYTFAQKSEIFHIDSLPTEGVVLDKGWKWHASDNPDWAKPDFDDTKWEETNVLEPMLKGSKILEAEISWFRKTIEVDSSLINKPLIIDLYITGAAEIYLNGQLIHKLGQVSKDPNLEKTYSPAYNMPFSILFSNTHNVLAIRFSLTSSSLYLPDYISFPPIDFTIKKLDGFTEKILEKSWKESFDNSVLIGIFLILTLLHLSFYYYYPSIKTNLFLGITMLVRTGHFISRYLSLFIISLKASYLYFLLDGVLYSLYYFLLILAIHRYLKKPLTVLFWIASTILLLGFFSSFFIGSNLKILAGCILFVYYVYMTRRDIKKGKREGILLYYAGILGLIGFTLLTFSRYSNELNILPIEYLMLLDKVGLWIAYLCIPIALSLTLARDFALTSLSLQKEFDENKKLSEEKQQILATQNETLEKQVEARTTELKAAQNQLIQKEKLASMGELTAGIAHEIQNPLNFVNNFSELSVDLVKDLKEEIEKPTQDKEYIGELFTDLSQNQEKINHHGKRASSIVKGMLEHSRASTGVKELTDINKLADEYLRLSYHGLRAKDNTFNADFKTDFDENLPKIEVISQDIGRVLLNLINNAFYAVKAPQPPKGENYMPTVSVSTHLEAPPLGAGGAQIIIKVKDNGIGMSESIRAKVFQPFFTTKPTGQGTGLGLSLAYDIVTKGHGGALEVESTEGVGSEFIIRLPNVL